MKKYFLMLAVFAATAVAMSSCDKGGDNGGGGGGVIPPTQGEWQVDSAVYYGEKLGAKSGLYSVHFSKKSVDGKDVQRLKFDFISSVATDYSKIKPANGDYKMGDKTALDKLTYIAAASAEDEDGTIYMDNNTPLLVTGGVVKITSSAGGFRFANNLQAGDKTIEFIYSGNIKFIDRHVKAPRLPIEVDRCAAGYRGEYVGASVDLGIVSLQLWNSTNPNKLIEMSVTVPLPKDIYEAEKIALPTGTLEVVSKVTGPNQIIAGTLEGGSFLNSWESNTIVVDGKAQFNGGARITGGNVTIEKTAEGTYTIKTNFSGKNHGPTGVELDNETGIVYIIEEVYIGDYVRDYTNPESDLTENLNLTNLTKIYLDAKEPWAMNLTGTLGLWRIILCEEALSFYLNPDDESQVYFNRAEGDALGVQVVATTTKTLPMGNYRMIKENEEFGDKMVYPTNVWAGSLLDPGAGTGYFRTGYHAGMDMYTNIKVAGSTPNRGFVNITSMPEDKVKMDVEFYDKYGWKVTATVEAKLTAMLQDTRAMSNHFIPAPTFIGLLNNGETLQIAQ